jgi:folate-binding protein YgfZ
LDPAHAVRESAVLEISGPDRVDFLQGQLTQDVRGMAPGDVRPAAALTPKGKILYVARLLALEDRFLLLLPAPSRGPVREHLAKYAAFQKVTLADRTDEMLRIGLYGSFPERPARTGWIPLPGEGERTGELLVPAPARAAALEVLEALGSRPLDAEAAERLRVEAGRPEFGRDFDGTHLADEVGLDEAISTTKGCYVGQEVVARMRTYGRVNRRLVGFRFPEGLVAPGTLLQRPGEDPGKIEWGRVTSAVLSDRLGPIGLGFAFRDVADGERLVATGSPHGSAVVAALPFR